MSGGARAIKLVQIARAAQSALWGACSSSVGLASWQADRVTGDVRRGERLTLEWPDIGAKVELEVRKIVPPELLVLENGQGTVELRVEPGAVTLTHRDLPDDADIEGLSSSWRVGLALLAHAVEHYPGRTRKVSWFARRVRTSPGSAFALFTEGLGLSLWLGKSSGIGTVGSGYSIVLQNGDTMRGRVLARVAERDTALSWEEREAVIVLRTIPTAVAGERLVALVYSSWGEAESPDRVTFSKAIDRLGRALAAGGTA
jgi:uncharacterized protein YndB with AHSA1/START domain